MAKGLRWYTYKDDSGIQYAVKLSKNVEGASALGFSPLTSTGTPRLPSGFKMRKVHAVRSGGTGQGFARRTFYVADRQQSIFAAKTPTNITYDGVAYVTTGKVGESMTFANTVDTGL